MHMRKIWLLATAVSLWPGLAFAQTTNELINKGNVKRLVPVWSTSLMNEMGELAAPTVYNGVMYVINGKWTFALDVETGRQIWRTPVQIEPGMTRTNNAFNRGAPTIYNGKLFRVTADNYLVALEMK